MRIHSTYPVVVHSIETLTQNVKRYTLVSVDGTALLPFHPGAHIETIVDTPGGPLLRHYSLCSSADEVNYYQIAIRKSDHSRGGSEYWHDKVKVGQVLRISAPINHFALSSRARHHVFVAGGIGITPFVSMLLELQRLKLELTEGDGADVQRVPRVHGSFELHVAAKSKALCPFQQWIEESFPGKVHFYFSDTGQRLTPLILHRQKLGTHLYLCGPQGMMQDFRDAARALHYPRENVHLEAFEAVHGDDDSPFRVILERRHQTLTISAEQTLLAGLRSAGVEVPSSCEVGGCGTCLVDVCQGEVDHRDFYLTEDEQMDNRQIVCCVSRAKGGTLVLDL